MGYDSRLIEPARAGSVTDLTLTRETSRNAVNQFLEREHPRGGVQFWHACFGARYDGSLVACVVFERPSARMLDDGSVIELTRFGVRDDRPMNTGSWLIAKARNWAELEGYDRLVTYAGVSGNYGTVYEAAGFECDDVSISDGAGWTTHAEDRQTWDDYERRRWVYELTECDRHD